MDKQKILVIDDESSQLELLDIFLSGKGYSVRCAASAREGLAEHAVFHPDGLEDLLHDPAVSDDRASLERLDPRRVQVRAGP